MRLIRSLLVLVVVAAVAMGVWWAQSSGFTSFLEDPQEPLGMAAPTDRPPVLTDLSPTPLGTPPPPPASGGSLAFTAFQDDGITPVTYDPCRQIHYVVSGSAYAPDPAVLQQAIGEISYSTGLQFVYDGETSELPSKERAEYQPDVYGQVWAPVLISWSDPGQYPDLEGTTTGLAGSTSVSTSAPGSKRYVTGQAVFDSPQLSDMDPDEVHAVVLHELAHVVGLDHVSDESELMYPELQSGGGTLGLGDRRGLAQLGTGPCFTDL